MKVGRIMDSERERGLEVSVRKGEIKGGKEGKVEVVENEKQVKKIQK